MIIETRALTKYYGKKQNRGIVDVNLSIQEGDFYGFIGPNGAGKSTTIRTLLGLITPTSGEATLFGRDCVKYKTENLRDIGYIASEAMFYSGLRVSEIISMSAKLRKTDCTEEARRLCERFEVETKKRIEELSLGNRKKVSIVCAMQHKPPLYILDEPTSGLDPLMQKEFFKLLSERQREGATIFLSSHVLSEIQRYCLHAGVVREGKLIASGTVEELTQSRAKRITLQGLRELPHLQGLLDVQHNGDGFSFLYQGSMPDFIQAMQGLPVTDMSITEPDLEEIFLHFYGGDAQ